MTFNIFTNPTGTLRPATSSEIATWNSALNWYSGINLPNVITSDSNRQVIYVNFDGTGNNKFKVNPEIESISNVGTIADSLSSVVGGSSIYLEGIGTLFDTWAENKLDSAIAYSLPSVLNTVFDRLADATKNMADEGVSPYIVVTGFSRGASEARIFMNLIDKYGIPESANLINGTLVLEPGTTFGPNSVRMSSILFDTVNTAMFDDYGSEFYGIPDTVDSVVHFTSINEGRPEFPLSSILSENEGASSRLLEFQLPGVHSDIGGGYPEEGVSKLALYFAEKTLQDWGLTEYPATMPALDSSTWRVHESKALIHEIWRFFSPISNRVIEYYPSESISSSAALELDSLYSGLVKWDDPIYIPDALKTTSYSGPVFDISSVAVNSYYSVYNSVKAFYSNLSSNDSYSLNNYTENKYLAASIALGNAQYSYDFLNTDVLNYLIYASDSLNASDYSEYLSILIDSQKLTSYFSNSIQSVSYQYNQLASFANFSWAFGVGDEYKYLFNGLEFSDKVFDYFYNIDSQDSMDYYIRMAETRSGDSLSADLANLNKKMYAIGSDGDDNISGGFSGDVFIGGKGDDTITVSSDDIIIFRQGDGHDTLNYTLPSSDNFISLQGTTTGPIHLEYRGYIGSAPGAMHPWTGWRATDLGGGGATEFTQVLWSPPLSTAAPDFVNNPNEYAVVHIVRVMSLELADGIPVEANQSIEVPLIYKDSNGVTRDYSISISINSGGYKQSSATLYLESISSIDQLSSSVKWSPISNWVLDSYNLKLGDVISSNFDNYLTLTMGADSVKIAFSVRASYESGSVIINPVFSVSFIKLNTGELISVSSLFETTKGSEDSDVLRANKNNQSIYGYEGDDVILSSDFSSYIEGGMGFDTYFISASSNPSYNYDTISDEDGSGQLLYEKLQIGSFTYSAEGSAALGAPVYSAVLSDSSSLYATISEPFEEDGSSYSKLSLLNENLELRKVVNLKEFNNSGNFLGIQFQGGVFDLGPNSIITKQENGSFEATLMQEGAGTLVARYDKLGIRKSLTSIDLNGMSSTDYLLSNSDFFYNNDNQGSLYLDGIKLQGGTWSSTINGFFDSSFNISYSAPFNTTDPITGNTVSAILVTNLNSGTFAHIVVPNSALFYGNYDEITLMGMSFLPESIPEDFTLNGKHLKGGVWNSISGVFEDKIQRITYSSLITTEHNGTSVHSITATDLDSGLTKSIKLPSDISDHSYKSAAEYYIDTFGPLSFRAGVPLNGAGSTIKSSISSAISQISTAPAILNSALVLDLNRDLQFSTAGASSGNYFNWNNGDVSSRSGWIQPQEGILVRDLNSNGVIDNVSELFSNKSTLINGATSLNGFTSLKELDSNGDNLISALDSSWSSLKVWQEGVGLTSLSDLGISSISTSSASSNTALGSTGNSLLRYSTVTYDSGASGRLGEVNFAQDPQNGITTTSIESLGLDAGTLSLINGVPNLSGFGKVSDLRISAARDASLLSLLTDILSTSNSFDQMRNKVDALVSKWAKADSVTAGSRGSFIDAKVISVVEAFNGEVIHAVNSTSALNPTSTAQANLIKSAYNSIIAGYYNQIIALTKGRDLLTALYSEGQGAALNYSAAVSYINQAEGSFEDQVRLVEFFANYLKLNNLPNVPTDLIKQQLDLSFDGVPLLKSVFEVAMAGGEIGTVARPVSDPNSSNIWQMTGDANQSISYLTYRALSTIVTGSGTDDISGGTGADLIWGGAGNDTIRGNAGNDVIYGGLGNDTIDGGLGFDKLYGGAGNDILGGVPTGYYGTNNDGGWYNTNYNPIGYVDPLSGNYYEGGTGDDTLNGTSRADVYVFNLGDGKDTINEIEVTGQPANQVDVIQYGEGINPADIKISRSGLDLVLSHINGSDKVTIKSWFNNSVGSTRFQIEQVSFKDGTVWNNAYLTGVGLVVQGSDSADTLIGLDTYQNTIYGLAGGDSITGGSLDDFLYGGEGNDTLNGGKGHDYLSGGAGNDILGTKNASDIGYVSGSSFVSPGAGNIYEGGSGSDTLNGTSLADTYLFSSGWGVDTIVEAEVQYQPANIIDSIVFDSSVNASDVTRARSGNNLVLAHVNGVDKIIVQDWYLPNAYSTSNKRIEEIVFNGGVKWEISNSSTTATTTDTLVQKNIVSGVNNSVLEWIGSYNAIVTQGSNILVNTPVSGAKISNGSSSQVIDLTSSAVSPLQILLEKANQDFIIHLGSNGSMTLAGETLGSGPGLKLPDGSLLAAQDLVSLHQQLSAANGGVATVKIWNGA